MRKLVTRKGIMSGFIAAALGWASIANAQEKGSQDGFAVGNFKDALATVYVNGKPQQSKINGALQFTIPAEAPHKLELKDLHFTGSSITIPIPGQKASPSGILSAHMTAAVSLESDGTGGFKGQFEAFLHYPLLDQLHGWTVSDPKEEGDNFVPVTEKVLVTIAGQFDKPLSDGSSDQGKMRTLSADIRVASINARLAEILMLFKSKMLVAVYDPPFRLDPSRFCFGPVKRLCVQPVGVKDSDTDPSPTGAAFPTLMAEADEMWERACVRFDERDFMYVVNPDWKIVTPSSQEESDLRNSVNVDDCVEVFFIEDWDPTGTYGGGATWSSGTANAKIITADANDNGIDLNHLAHELGHVLNLSHPGNPIGGLAEGTEGTVMCPSGWMRDNPDVQSEENGDNASNPLLTFPMELCCKNLDCTDDTDCGPCSPLPSDNNPGGNVDPAGISCPSSEFCCEPLENGLCAKRTACIDQNAGEVCP